MYFALCGDYKQKKTKVPAETQHTHQHRKQRVYDPVNFVKKFMGSLISDELLMKRKYEN